MKLSVRVILVAVSLVVCCAIGTAYYFIFDIHWGIDLTAQVWGLPFFIVISALIVFSIFLIIKKNREKTLKIILIFANTISFCALGIIYFVAFNIQRGISWQMVTWGFPVLVGIIFIVLDTIFMIKKRNWKIGLRGFGIGWTAYVYIGVLAWFFSSVFLGTPVNGPKITPDTEENRIMTLVVNYFCRNEVIGYNEGYTVIDPHLKLGFVYDKSMDYFKKIIINNYMSNPNHNDAISQSINSTIGKLKDSAFESSLINIKSSPNEGYYIDYDGVFESYFDFYRYPGGWETWRAFHRNARGSMQLSSIAYDDATGIIAVHVGFQGDYLLGAGHLIVFRLEDGKLTIIGGIQTWVS